MQAIHRQRMILLAVCGLLCSIALMGCEANDAHLVRQPIAMEKLSYPATATDDQVDEYFGTLVADPYRWLEDADSE